MLIAALCLLAGWMACAAFVICLGWRKPRRAAKKYAEGYVPGPSLQCRCTVLPPKGGSGLMPKPPPPPPPPPKRYPELHVVLRSSEENATEEERRMIGRWRGQAMETRER